MPEFSTATATALSIAQSLLVAEKDKGPITAALITERVAIAASVVAPGNEESVDRAAAVAELIQSRFNDTVLGCLVGLVGGICLHSRHFRALLGPLLRRLLPSRPTQQGS